MGWVSYNETNKMQFGFVVQNTSNNIKPSQKALEILLNSAKHSSR